MCGFEFLNLAIPREIVPLSTAQMLSFSSGVPLFNVVGQKLLSVDRVIQLMSWLWIL